jgi:hypothetical protein
MSLEHSPQSSVAEAAQKRLLGRRASGLHADALDPNRRLAVPGLLRPAGEERQ